MYTQRVFMFGCSFRKREEERNGKEDDSITELRAKVSRKRKPGRRLADEDLENATQDL